MIYETKIVAGISKSGFYGRKKLILIKGKWLDLDEISEMYGLTRQSVSTRILKCQPLNLTRDELVLWTQEMKGGGSDTPLSVCGVLCDKFLLSPSHIDIWNQFHKQGTDDWKVCAKCGREKPPEEYRNHSRTNMPLSGCRPCRDTMERDRRAAYNGAAVCV